jgi:hypothetical protein
LVGNALVHHRLHVLERVLGDNGAQDQRLVRDDSSFERTGLAPMTSASPLGEVTRAVTR